VKKIRLDPKTPKLALERLTIRTLVPDELAAVAGGAPQVRCSAPRSGCGVSTDPSACNSEDC
jgi:hypothetical protein